MKTWTIRQRIVLSFGLVLTLMLGMGTTALIYAQSMQSEARRAQEDSAPGLHHSTHLLTAVLDDQARTARHVLSTDKYEMQQLAAQIQSGRTAADEMLRSYGATNFQAGERDLFEAVRAARAEYLREQDHVLEASTALQNGAAAALFTAALEPRFEKLRAAVQVLMEHNETSTDAALQAISDSVASSHRAIVFSIAAALLLAFAAAQSLFHAVSQPLTRLVDALNVLRQGDFTGRLKLGRSDEFGSVADGFDRMADELAALVGQVQKSGLQVTTSVTEISATAKEQQATAKEIAATTAEIGATSQEISATSKELARTMSEVSDVAERSAALASGGQTGLTHMEETMQQVMEGAGSITTKLGVLSEKAGNINQVIVTITKVADQTNLLSLNAAIEAEKAGDQGRGFAVVATEIRRLADQTAVATYDIEQTVKEIQSAVSASVMGMDKFSEELRRGMQEIQQIGGQLSEIIQQVQALVPRFESVNEGMRAQATGAEQITEALSQLNDAAQQTAESLRESSAAIEELKQVANGLRGGVSRFKLSAA